MLKEIMQVFTKEYKEETKYYKARDGMKSKIHLGSNVSYTEDEKIKRFADIDSKCSIEVGKNC